MSRSRYSMNKSDYTFPSSMPMNMEYIEQLHDKWVKHFAGLEKTPLEIKLATNRAERDASNTAKIRGPQRVQKKLCRPITALYASPRTTNRMRHVLNEHMPKKHSIPKKSLTDNIYCHLCPQCGFVRDSKTPEEHGELMRQRLNRFLAKNPSLRRVVKS